MELVICKSCGYVMDKSRLKDKCPACGVLAKMFEPYTEKISPRRKLLLTLQIHPILVHFPIAFTVSLLVLALFALVVHDPLKTMVATVIAVMAVVQPFTILLAFLGGLVDGKTRFRRFTTQILTTKIFLGILFLVVTCGITATVLFRPLAASGTLLLVAGLSIPALACVVILGLLGSSILNAKLPG